MKRQGAILLAVTVLVAALAYVSSPSAQEPIPVVDLGITAPITAACTALIPSGEDQGLVVKNCRRSKPDEWFGPNKVKVHVRIVTDRDTFDLDVSLTKSLWDVGSVIQR